MAPKSESGPAKLPPIASLWIGSELSWLELLCIRSYLNLGHEFTLYTLDLDLELPEGAVLKDAREIYAPTFDLTNNDRINVVVYADIFRLHLFLQTDAIWVDMDTYAKRPINPNNGYVLGLTEDGALQNATLRLPPDSKSLAKMLDFCESPNPIQPWRGKNFIQAQKDRIANGESWGIQDLPWGCSGPKALTYFAKQTSEIDFAMAPAVYNKVTADNHKKLFQKDDGYFDDPEIVSLHFFGATKKAVFSLSRWGVPKLGTVFSDLCKEAGVDPSKAPIKPVKGFFDDPRRRRRAAS